jgi:hypothetical protein
MKRVRTVNLMVMLGLLLALSYMRTPVFADGCSVPGVVGLGSSEAAAVADCVDYGVIHCSGFCRTRGCNTDVVTPPAICDQTWGGGSSWTAAGYCRCGVWSE